MNGIVNRNLVTRIGSDISSDYIPQTGTGQGLAAGMEGFASGVKTALSIYNGMQQDEKARVKEEKEAQAQADLISYEKDIAELFEYQQNYGLTPTETSVRLARIQNNHPHVPADKRNQVDNRYLMNTTRSLFEANEKNALEAQHNADKALVESMTERLPGIFNNLEWEDAVIKARDIQQYTGVLANLAVGIGEKDDYNNEMFLAAAKKGVVDEMYNWFGLVNKETPINASNIADIELRLQQSYVQAGVDARIATLATEQVLEPYKRVLENFSETQEIKAKALEAAFNSRLNPLTQQALKNYAMLQYLPTDSKALVEADIVASMQEWTPQKADSLNHLFSYGDYAQQTTPQATQTSFNMGFATMRGATPTDDEIQRNITVNSAVNLRKQVNFAEAQKEQLPVPLNGQSFMEAQANFNNNEAITSGEIDLLNTYNTGSDYRKQVLVSDIQKGLDKGVKGVVDLYLIQKHSLNPAERQAAADLNRESLQTRTKYATGALWGEDFSSVWLANNRIIFDEELGEVRILEKMRKGELVDRLFGRVLDIDGKKWVDVTDESPVLGFGEEPQRLFKQNRDKINADIDKYCDAEGLSSKECTDFKASLWRDAVAPYSGESKRTGGYVGEGVQTALEAPVKAVYSAGETIGETAEAAPRTKIANVIGDITQAAAEAPGEAVIEAVKFVKDKIGDIKEAKTLKEKELTNPGNIKASSANAWEGKTGETYTKSGNSFEIFETPELGFRAMFKLLETYNTKYGADTIEKIIKHWDMGNEKYIKDLVQTTGIARDEYIALQDKEKMVSLAYKMALIEKGYEEWNKYTTEQVEAGYDLAFRIPQQIQEEVLKEATTTATVAVKDKPEMTTEQRLGLLTPSKKPEMTVEQRLGLLTPRAKPQR